MNRKSIIRFKTILLSGFLAIGLSCSNDAQNDLLNADQKVSESEVRTILEVDEFSSAADTIVTTIFQEGASGKSSKNEECYITDFSDTGYTVTFDNCSIEEGGEVLNGSLNVIYTEGEESNEFTTTYSDLSVDGIIINGTRNFTMNGDGENENVSFTIVSDMRITLADGSIVEEAGTKLFAVNFDFEEFTNSNLTIDGNWVVKDDGNTYSIDITTDLVALFSCNYVSEGIMVLTKNGLEATVDFGDGTCDNVATIRYPDGTVENFNLDD